MFASIMLPLYLFDPLFDFFTEIDRILSSDVKNNPDTDERAVTGTLLWFLNSESEPRGDFGDAVKAFRQSIMDLAGDEFPIGVLFETEGYSQNFEGDVTQADYAFNIRFRDTSTNASGDNDWDATYFMQSKVARLRSEEEGWGPYSTFSRDKRQSDVIERLRGLIGSGGLRYHLYCPTKALKLVPKALLLKKLAASEPGSPILDHYANAGFWLNNSFPASINALFSSQTYYPVPWAIFILAHFFGLQAADGTEIQTDKLYSNLSDPKLEERQAIFNRDRDALERAIAEKEKISGKKIVRHERYFTEGPRRTISIDIEFPKLDYDSRPDPDPSPSTTTAVKGFK